MIEASNSQTYSHIHQPGSAVGGHCIPVYPHLYRTGVKETAFSGVFRAVAALRERGAEVVVHDAYYDDEEIRSFGWDPYTLGGNATGLPRRWVTS